MAGTSNNEPYQELEDRFAAFVGTRYATSCSSGTSALILALAALGIGEGHEVIVPDFGMAATAFAVSIRHARPIFVDCRQDLQINTDQIEAAVTPFTRAIIVTHVYGMMADMLEVQRIATKHGLRVIEDACEAHGAQQHGVPAGAWGDLACFSFYKNKIVAAEEGGIVVTNALYLKQRLDSLKSLAFTPEHDFDHTEVAYNFRMPNAQAKLALESLAKVDANLKKRAEVYRWYEESMTRGHAVTPPPGSVAWVYPRLFDRYWQDRIYSAVKPEVRYFFRPMRTLQAYGAVPGQAFPMTAGLGLAARGLYFPIDPAMTKSDVQAICRKVGSA